MIRLIINAINNIIKKLKKFIVLSRYNNATIAQYFRNQGAQIGENCIIVPRTIGTEPYLVKIGNHVVINKGVEFHTHDGGTWIFRQEYPDMRVYGPIIIEDNCLIGSNVIILPDVRIGKNSIIGAGSVVISDVSENSIAMGIPARKFGSVEKYKLKCIEKWKEQKPSDLHSDAVKNYEFSKHQKLILSQLRRKLTQHFSDKLK